MTLLQSAVNAYVAILGMPPKQRIHFNGELCGLRDAIAEATGLDIEVVQATYESIASLRAPR